MLLSDLSVAIAGSEPAFRPDRLEGLAYAPHTAAHQGATLLRGGHGEEVPWSAHNFWSLSSYSWLAALASSKSAFKSSSSSKNASSKCSSCVRVRDASHAVRRAPRGN